MAQRTTITKAVAKSGKITTRKDTSTKGYF